MNAVVVFRRVQQAAVERAAQFQAQGLTARNLLFEVAGAGRVARGTEAGTTSALVGAEAVVALSVGHMWRPVVASALRLSS